MVKILVLFHSWTGSVYKLAIALTEGANSVSEVDATIKQVPEFVSEDVLAAAGATEPRKEFADIPIATIDELPEYDGYAFGTPTRFGNMSSTMRSFLDQTGRYYVEGDLADKPATVFCSTGSGGGQETTITSFWNTLAHHGMIIVPLGYRAAEIRDVASTTGGSPYGASSYARGDGDRPSATELSVARTQGIALSKIAAKLAK
jgi:NAD(P)H dehydrogenase (quinone)